MTIIIIAVLTVAALALLRRSSTEAGSVAAQRRYAQALSCADGARQLLVSQFRTFGASPTSLVLDENVGNQRITTGHYDQFAVATVAADSGAQSASQGVSDIGNRTQTVSLGGVVYRFTVVCSDTGSAEHQAEVEFLVRFGL